MEAFEYFKGRNENKPGLSLADHMFAFYSANSGLTPVERYSLTDHMRAYYITKVGTQYAGRSLRDLERLFYVSEGLDTSEGLARARQLYLEKPLDSIAPAVPFAFTAEPDNGAALLSWDDNTDDTTGYEIFQDNVHVTTATGRPAVISGLTNGVAYKFKIRATDAAGNKSAFTEEFQVTPAAPDTTAPTVPTGLTATAGDGYVDLSWTASTDNVGVDGYEITRDGAILTSVGGTSYRAGGLTNGVTYGFAVRAFDVAGNKSAYTATVSAKPVAATPANWLLSWYGLGIANGTILTATLVGPNSPADDPFSAVANSPVLRSDLLGPNGEERVMVTVPNSTTATQWRYNDRAQDVWQFREYIEVGGALPTATSAPIVYGTKTSGGLYFKVVVSTTNNLNFINAANAYVKQTPALANGLYRLEMFRASASSLIEVRVYNASDGSTVYSSNFDTGVLVTDTLDDLILGRQSGAAFGPWYMGGFVIGNLAQEVGADSRFEAPPVVYRDQTQHPFAAGSEGTTTGSFWNTTVSTAVVTEEPVTGNKTHNLTSRAGGTIYTMNYTSWSVKRLVTDETMPVVTLRRPNGGATWYSHLRIDPNFNPPNPSNGDRNSTIIDVDGVTAYDCYKLTKISDTIWESSSVDSYRLDGMGGKPGVRAANLPLVGGQITKSRVQRILAGEVDDFGHILAISIPKEILTNDVTAEDGVVVTLYNGYCVQPAHAIDNQANVPYSGTAASGWAMGSMLVLRQDITVASLNPADLLETATLNTLQRFGAVTTDQSGTIALYGEFDLTTSEANSIINAWRHKAAPNIRRVKSNSEAGGWGGRPSGGVTTRRAPSEPLLPLNPNL